MASIKPRKRGGTELSELDAEMRRSFSMKMGQIKRLKQEVHEDDPDSGVIYVSHIPHGFYEPQMKKFFSQFGNIKRLRLSRSKKSGRSRGFAYVEFEFSEVAKVVAETMHNYLMYRKLLKCFYVPKEKLHPNTFKGCFRHFKRPRRREIAAARNNRLLESDKEHILKSQERRVSSLQKKQKKLQSLGIEFKIDGLESELKRLKESELLTAQGRVEKATLASKERVKQSPPAEAVQAERTTVKSKGNKSVTKSSQPKVTRVEKQKHVSSKVKSKSMEEDAGTRPAGEKIEETTTPAQKLKKGAKSAKMASKTKSVKSGAKKTKRKSL